jgi:hypothetical protein
VPIPHLNEFRHQYPTASLRTDLLAIHDSSYVVRAQVWVEGELLASAMAADAALETAEDRACLRVLQCLSQSEILLTPEPAAVAKMPAPPPEPPAVNGAVGQRGAAPPQPAPPPAPVKKQPPLPEEPGSPLLTEPAPFEDWANDPPSPAAVELQSAEPLAGSVSPVDLSDIIAQTDVELRRLGWTVGQGREFLEKTYGKRSRHDLTDQELLEFLLYLETQPSPVEG